jgi:transposase InsO family protein
MRKQPEVPTVGSQYLVNGRLMGVIHVDEGLVTLRDLERPYTRSLTVDAFMTEVSHRTIVPFARPPGDGSNALAFLNPQAPDVIAATRKLRYVEAAGKELGGSLPVKATEALIKRVSLEMGDPSPPCYNSLYKWTKYYNQHNRDRFCLLKERSYLPRGKRLDPNVENIIQEMIKQEYLKEPPSNPSSILRYIDGQITLINRLREGYSTCLLKSPSLSTVQRKIKKLCQLTSDLARHGTEYVKKHHHSSKLSDEPLELLELAEIDNHLLDIVIIDGKGKVLGKILWWTVIFEIKTRIVIGWELSTTYPCAEKTIRALKKALQAVPGEERRRGKPIYLHSDNGAEFVNAIIRNFLDRLGILFNRGPPYTANARARIERFFLTFELWLHVQPGTTMSTPAEREYYDSEGEAAFTEVSMNRHVEDWIEGVYHQRPHRTLNMPPAVAWERAMRNRLPPEKFTEEDLDTLCRGVETATISAAGRVQFLCLSWYGGGLQEIRSKLKQGQSAICYYNPLDLGEIWVAHPDDSRNPVPAYATHPEYQNGLTLTEHDLLHKQYLAAGREFDDSVANVALLLLRQRMAKEYEESRKLRSNAKSGKNSELLNDTDLDNLATTAVPEEKSVGDGEIPIFKVDRL